MSKLLVEVKVPILEKKYDMFIPQEAVLYEVLDLIKKVVEELSEGQFATCQDNVLCYRESGDIMDINKTIYELGITNGAKLTLL